ncbi:N-acetylmuramoyl-L-alanine amidase [Persicirhabdus sediminis]|uniref:N-acetylmuramoyl-L-alanine amidase n=1 Tax=Persicirhabdus sediminis TaxID=454144 RepID=A0A8J7MFY9_9BACT|nr:N-acetylmuramoyl-L-alanine amidase [Persicirhabdus sediminis]MBK1792312.1 N-acetylmuramoyl-L-alanine amidase [Persicirhabdus sediminis]
MNFYHSITYSIYLALASLMLASGQLDARNFDRVILDPGHGGSDKGCLWGGVREKEMTLKLAKKVESRLKANGVPVVMTRRSDLFVSLQRRAYISTRYRNAIFVSLHYNAHTNTSVYGLESFYYSPEGKKLATPIHRELQKRFNLKDRGIRKKDFYVLRKTACPAALIEVAYLSNPAERRRFSSEAFQWRVARAIAYGILQYRKMP